MSNEEEQESSSATAAADSTTASGWCREYAVKGFCSNPDCHHKPPQWGSMLGLIVNPATPVSNLWRRGGGRARRHQNQYPPPPPPPPPPPRKPAAAAATNSYNPPDLRFISHDDMDGWW